jgi:hypothetical protein
MEIPDENVLNCNGPLTLKSLEWFLETLQRRGSAAIIGVTTEHARTLTEISLDALRPHVTVLIPPTLPAVTATPEDYRSVLQRLKDRMP